MKKIQQFYVIKFPSSRLAKCNYNIKRTIQEARRNKEMIALGDSQVLRIIRSIRYDRNHNVLQYNFNELMKLFKAQKHLSKLESTQENAKKLEKINQKIDTMLFVPEYISVIIENKKHYKTIIKNGLIVNGFKYVRLLCSAGNARVNTVVFIREDFEKEVKHRLRNGAKSVEITKNKYNAYFALSSSSTFPVSTPTVLLVNDCEIEMTKKVDWIESKEKISILENSETIKAKYKTMKFNLFDGCGAISVEYAKKISKELGLDYLPSAFCIRCAYIKGMVFVVDFKKFAKEVAGVSYIEDKYNSTSCKKKYLNVDDIDLILTKSQFKLHNAYDSMDDYHKRCKENGIIWGVTKVSPKTDTNYFRSNYQFNQVLNLRDEDIQPLCQPTIDWLKGILGEDVNKTILFLSNKICNDEEFNRDTIFSRISDIITKALVLQPELIKDEYIKRTIIRSINKKIKETYIGKLLLRGNFSVMIPDMYAFMEHAFGLPVKGLLKEYEHYSNYWNKHRVKNVVAMRSPLTWRSEINKLNLVNNDQTNKWFQYLTSGIVYNVWGCDCIIHADSDFDGDLVSTTDNKIFIDRRYDCLPITYEKRTVNKEFIKEEDLYKADLDSFNSKIGQITNRGTTMTEVLAKYEGNPKFKRHTSELINRLKLTRKAQGDAIDQAKGIKVQPMPKFWTKRFGGDDYYNIIKDDKGNEIGRNLKPQNEIEKMNFYNEIVADKPPYFFRYLYSDNNVMYLNYLKTKNNYAFLKFGKQLEEILNSTNLTQEEKEFKQSYLDYLPLTDNNSSMNKICHYMEQEFKELPLPNTYRTPNYVIELMMYNNDVDKNKLKLMDELYKEFNKERRQFNIDKHVITHEQKNNVSLDNTFREYSRQIRIEANKISNNSNELADLSLYLCYKVYSNRSKEFAWVVFGEDIIENLKLKIKKPVLIPIVNEKGNIEYLNKNYKLTEVKI